MAMVANASFLLHYKAIKKHEKNIQHFPTYQNMYASLTHIVLFCPLLLLL